MVERSEDSLDSDAEVDGVSDDTRARLVQKTLVSDHHSRSLVPWFYMLSLTCGVGGLQVVWSVILSNGSPFLLSLGLSKSLSALVWIAAPLCGVIVQPLVGALSDRTRSRWGRRRPFIIAGAFGVVVTMLALAWVEEIFHGISKAVARSPNQESARVPIILAAIFCIYALNVCIQPLQAGLRTLVIENTPAHQQTQASAWASAMTGIGNIVGYLAGFTNLPNIVSNHLTQFQCLCLIASISLATTVTLSCSIREQNSPHIFPVRLEKTGCMVILRDLIHTYKFMPKRIRRVCHIQFLAWMGWFPFLFYSTTYIAEFYTGRAQTMTLPNRTQIKPRLPGSAETKAIYSDGIRFGTFASFLFAIVAFLTNLILPPLLHTCSQTPPTKKAPHRQQILTAWTCAHTFFAFAMLLTFFATSQAAATFIVASAGLSWALTLWAPFAIIGNEIAAMQDTAGANDDDDNGSSSSLEIQAGAIMGLHNVAISAPQIFAALVCSAIFWLARLAENPYGTGWVLRAGGCAALGAGVLTYRFEV